MLPKRQSVLQQLTESVDYSDDDIPITIVTPDEHHQYERVGGVLYELNPQADNQILYTSTIEHTPENTFYEDQIDRYVEYIQDGGALESFPVQPDPEPSIRELYNMFIEQDEDELEFDRMWDLFNDYKLPIDTDEFHNFLLEAEEYFGDDWEDMVQYWIETKKKYTYENVDTEDYDDPDDLESDFPRQKIDKYLETFYEILEKVIQIQKEEDWGVYTLTDMNHRFAAIQRLGIDKVWAEIV